MPRTRDLRRYLFQRLRDSDRQPLTFDEIMQIAYHTTTPDQRRIDLHALHKMVEHGAVLMEGTDQPEDPYRYRINPKASRDYPYDHSQ